MRKVFFAMLVFFAMTPMASHAIGVSEVTNPIATNGGFVADEGRVLGPEYERLLNEVSSAVKADGGAELVIVTVDNLSGLVIEEYAVKLFERFKIGSKDRNDGILILMSREDRKIRIEVGYGLEGVFNDALTGRLIDENAIPNFKEGQFGKGVYLLARAVAEKIAPQEPQKTEKAALAKPENLNQILLIYFIAMLVLTLFGIGWVSIKIYSKKAKAAKEEVICGFLLIPLLQWVGGGIAIIVIAVMQRKNLLPISIYLVSSISMTAFVLYARGLMEVRIKKYRLSCSGCSKPMRLIAEDEDDKLLSQEEIAEEKAEGMDYEFWVCDSCKKTERLDVRMSGANKCPQCKRLSVKRESKVLQSATEHHVGRREITRTCLNASCGFHDVKEEEIPKKPSSHQSSSSGFHGGGSSSSGGGSSGGGGASRGWG